MPSEWAAARRYLCNVSKMSHPLGFLGSVNCGTQRSFILVFRSVRLKRWSTVFRGYKNVLVTDAKEVGVGNPAEETFCH